MAGEIFHPLRWTSRQALNCSKMLPRAGTSGRGRCECRRAWRMNRPARAQVKATVGANAPSRLGLEALLDFKIEVTLEGERLSAAEI